MAMSKNRFGSRANAANPSVIGSSRQFAITTFRSGSGCSSPGSGTNAAGGTWNTGCCTRSSSIRPTITTTSFLALAACQAAAAARGRRACSCGSPGAAGRRASCGPRRQRRRSSSQPGSFGFTVPNGTSTPPPWARHVSARRSFTPRTSLVQQRVEAAGPGADDALLLEQLRHQRAGLGRAAGGGTATARPHRFTSMITASSPCRRGSGGAARWRFSPRIFRFASSGTSAACTFASCDAKLRPPTSLPYSMPVGPQFAHGHLDAPGRRVEPAGLGDERRRAADRPRSRAPSRRRCGRR